jgi:hypothetical protein
MDHSFSEDGDTDHDFASIMQSVSLQNPSASSSKPTSAIPIRATPIVINNNNNRRRPGNPLLRELAFGGETRGQAWSPSPSSSLVCSPLRSKPGSFNAASPAAGFVLGGVLSPPKLFTNTAFVPALPVAKPVVVRRSSPGLQVSTDTTGGIYGHFGMDSPVSPVGPYADIPGSLSEYTPSRTAAHRFAFACNASPISSSPVSPPNQLNFSSPAGRQELDGGVVNMIKPVVRRPAPAPSNSNFSNFESSSSNNSNNNNNNSNNSLSSSNSSNSSSGGLRANGFGSWSGGGGGVNSSFNSLNSSSSSSPFSFSNTSALSPSPTEPFAFVRASQPFTPEEGAPQQQQQNAFQAPSSPFAFHTPSSSAQSVCNSSAFFDATPSRGPHSRAYSPLQSYKWAPGAAITNAQSPLLAARQGGAVLGCFGNHNGNSINSNNSNNSNNSTSSTCNSNSSSGAPKPAVLPGRGFAAINVRRPSGDKDKLAKARGEPFSPPSAPQANSRRFGKGPSDANAEASGALHLHLHSSSLDESLEQSSPSVVRPHWLNIDGSA